MGRIDGFSTVITGGASGMGRSTAELFIAEGAHVVVGDMNKQNGEALVEEMRATVADLRRREADLKVDRDHWRDAHSATQRLLPKPMNEDAQPVHRSWWRRLAG